MDHAVLKVLAVIFLFTVAHSAVYSRRCPAVDKTVNCFRQDDIRCNTDADCVAPNPTCCPTMCGGTNCANTDQSNAVM